MTPNKTRILMVKLHKPQIFTIKKRLTIDSPGRPHTAAKT